MFIYKNFEFLLNNIITIKIEIIFKNKFLYIFFKNIFYIFINIYNWKFLNCKIIVNYIN